jgi:hypothetical protein
MNPLFIIYAGISGTFSTQIFDASVTINLSLINLLDKDQRDALWRNYILKF